jgi:hypothetical protein
VQERLSNTSPAGKACLAFLVLAAMFAWLSTLLSVSVACSGTLSELTKRTARLACCQLVVVLFSVVVVALMAKEHPMALSPAGNRLHLAVVTLVTALLSFLTASLDTMFFAAHDSDKDAEHHVHAQALSAALLPGSGGGTGTGSSLVGYSRPSGGHGGGGGPSMFLPGAASTRIQTATAADGSTVFAAQRQEIGIGVSGNLVNLVLAVDRSGSMAGSRWNSVQRGVAEALGQLTDVDVVTIIPFNDTVQLLGPAPKCRFPIREFAALSTGGNTKLYDAAALALMTALRLHEAVDHATPMARTTYVVVMTDGEDNGSRATIQELQTLVLALNRVRDFEVRTRRCSLLTDALLHVVAAAAVRSARRSLAYDRHRTVGCCCHCDWQVIFAGVDLPAAGRSALRYVRVPSRRLRSVPGQ